MNLARAALAFALKTVGEYTQPTKRGMAGRCFPGSPLRQLRARLGDE